MSVSFWVEGLEDIKVPHTPTHPDHLNPFWDCSDGFCFELIRTGFSVSNSNARLVLSPLGLAEGEDWWSGSIQGEDLRERTLVAMATASDGAIEATVTKLEDGPTLIDCGVPAGYLAEKYALLMGLAEQAISLGSEVRWG